MNARIKGLCCLFMAAMAAICNVSATTLSAATGPYAVSLTITGPAQISTGGSADLTNAAGLAYNAYPITVGSDTNIMIAEYRDINLAQGFDAIANTLAAYSIDPGINPENIQIQDMLIDGKPGAVGFAYSPKEGRNVMIGNYLSDEHTIVAIEVAEDIDKFSEIIKSIHVARPYASSPASWYNPPYANYSQGGSSVDSGYSGYEGYVASEEQQQQVMSDYEGWLNHLREREDANAKARSDYLQEWEGQGIASNTETILENTESDVSSSGNGYDSSSYDSSSYDSSSYDSSSYDSSSYDSEY